MSDRQRLATVLGVLLVTSAYVRGQSSAPAAISAPPEYDVDYIGPRLPDPIMQHYKETYVIFGCAYCHGLTLTPRGEAADLMHSPLVGVDVDGSTIVPLLKAGIPQTAKLSPMPQFSDLSDQQLHAIARYIHYARQLGRYKEIVESRPPAGDASAGKAYFDQQCATCHATDLNGVGHKYDESGLRDQVLRPKNLAGPSSFAVTLMNDTKKAMARQRHNVLLENYTFAQVADLLVYLRTR